MVLALDPSKRRSARNTTVQLLSADQRAIRRPFSSCNLRMSRAISASHRLWEATISASYRAIVLHEPLSGVIAVVAANPSCNEIADADFVGGTLRKNVLAAVHHDRNCRGSTLQGIAIEGPGSARPSAEGRIQSWRRKPEWSRRTKVIESSPPTARRVMFSYHWVPFLIPNVWRCCGSCAGGTRTSSSDQRKFVDC